VPTAGILIGGAMAATSLTGRRLFEELDSAHAEIEARLCLGDSAREALKPTIRRAIHTGLTPAIDQTRSVGLVTLPGAFVGLLLGGASPAEAASTQLVVLLSLLAVELAAAALLAEFVQRAAVAPGERVRRLRS
jgi:putative ABC transport system permease protein